MFFQKNTQALLRADEAHRPMLARLQDTESAQDFEFYETDDGNVTLQYKGILLHDAKSPVQEATHAIQAHCHPAANRVHLILGIGLGYLPDQVFHASPGQLIIYEPDLPLLRFVLENVDLSEMLDSGRVKLTDSQAELLAWMHQKLYQQYQMDVLLLKSAAFILAEQIPALMEQLTSMELDRMQDLNTGQHFHLQWLGQFFLNCPAFASMNTADVLFGQFKDKPALVISRGPSLDDALEHIKQLADSTVLIAVGSAVRRLHEAGIVPDFAIFYDANGIQEQLHGIPESTLGKITFLVSPFTQKCCFESPACDKLLFLGQNNAQFADWLETVYNRKLPRIEGGGTVSIVALQMALAMQCNPVILVGQDLAFPDNRVYAGGVQLQTDEQGKLALQSSETLYAGPETMDTVLGQSGKMLPTLKAYKGFIRHLEDLAARNNSQQAAKLYNASQKGAKIEGYERCNLAQFEFKSWKNGQILSQIAEFPDTVSETQNQALTDGLSSLKGKVQEAITLCKNLQSDFDKKTASPSQEAAQAVRNANRQLGHFMQQNPFVAFMVMFEMIEFQKQANNPIGTTGQEQEILGSMLASCVSIFQEKALPWIVEAEQALQPDSGQPEPILQAGSASA